MLTYDESSLGMAPACMHACMLHGKHVQYLGIPDAEAGGVMCGCPVVS